MGGAIDLKAGSRSLTGQNLYKVNKSPLDQFNEGVDDVIGKAAGNTSNMFMALVGGVFSDLASVITNIPNEFTGLIAQALPEMAGQLLNVGGWFTDLESLLGNPTGLGTGNPLLGGLASSIPLLGPLFSAGGTFLGGLIPGLDATQIVSGQFPASMISGLEAAGMDFVSLVLSFIPGYTGTDQTQAQTDFGTLGGNLLSLLGNPAGMLGTPTLPGVGSIPLLGGLFGGTGTFLGGLIPGLDATQIVSGQFPQAMISGLASLLSGFGSGSSIIDQLLSLWPNTAGGLTGLPGLSSIYSDVLGLLGHPTSLGSGSPALPGISSIPLLGGLFGGGGGGTFLGSLIPGLDATQIVSGQFPQTMVQGLESALANAGASFADLVSGLFGISGGNQSMFNTLGGNLMSLLGSPNLNPAGAFDPVAAGGQMLQQVLTPAGALTSLTQIPMHLFGNLTTPGQTTNALQNADPTFDYASSLDGQGLWTWDGTVDHTGRAGSGSARAVASGALIGLNSVPISTTANQDVVVQAYVRWTGMSASTGNAIQVLCRAYDANDNLIGTSTSSTAVTAPTTNSATYAGADANGWVLVQGGYQTPTGTAYVRMAVEVGGNVVAGTVWVDDLALTVSGIIDATSLFNFESMAEGIIPGPAMAGFQGLVNIFESFAHLVDGLGSAASMTPQSGLDFSDLFTFMQDLAANADQGGAQGAINTNILGIRNNKPVSAGANSTSEAMHPISLFGSNGAMTTTSVAAGTSIAQTFRASEVAQKGFFEFIGAGSGLTNIFTNIFTVDPSTGNKTLLWGSNDISGLIGTSLGYVKSLIPGPSQPTVNAGQNLLLEIVNGGSAALTVATRNTGQPTHPTDFPKNLGTTRALSTTGGNSPASLTDAQVTYSANHPYVNLGMQSVPAGFVAPQLQQFTGNGTWNRPGGFTDGDLVDYFLLGGGGGGQSGGYGAAGYGGQAGQWATGTFVIGSDVHGTGYPVLPDTTTALAVTVGAGGPGGWNPYVLQPGSNGTATTLSGAGITTKSAAGGIGGGNGFTGDGTSGQGAGNRTIGAYTAYGGAETAINANAASAPGGGGSSGYPALGNDGAPGKAWIRTRQWGQQ